MSTPVLGTYEEQTLTYIIDKVLAINIFIYCCLNVVSCGHTTYEGLGVALEGIELTCQTQLREEVIGLAVGLTGVYLHLHCIQCLLDVALVLQVAADVDGLQEDIHIA